MDGITETSLEALIQRATDPRNKTADTAAIDAFCGIIKKEPDGVFVATRLIASKIQSSQEREALQGLSVLEACMKNCGPSFRSEVAKFRFLNEMIKIVSPKFMASRTAAPVRNQVLKLMYAWTLSYPKEQKIKEAYDMLKKQGVINNELETAIEETTQNNRTPQKSHPLFQDDEKVRLLKKLLQSKNPDDLQAANRLIKTMVKEDERKLELKSKKINELETIRNNVRLLSEMLDSYRPGQATSEEIQLIKELYDGCKALRPNVTKIPADVQDSDELLQQVLSVSLELGQVLDKHSAVMVSGRSGDKIDDSGQDSKQISSLLDFNSPTEASVPQTQKVTKTSDILNDLLAAFDVDTGLPINSDKTISINHKTDKTNFNIDALEDIFAPLPVQNAPLLAACSSSPSPKPAEGDKTSEKAKFGNHDKRGKMKALDDLDLLGETLLQKCKMDSAAPSTPRSAEATDEATTPDSKDSNAEDAHGSVKNDGSDDDDELMDLGDVADQSKPPAAAPAAATAAAAGEAAKQEVKPLTDVSVTLESIKPSSIPPITVVEDKNGVSVTLYIAKDAPREDVTVLVVTTVSKNPTPVTNYLFQAVVPKGCKLKLQPPSGSELPAHNPFLPPSAITQILLIANPNKVDVALKCMISFTVDDETITEMGEVENLPRIT